MANESDALEREATRREVLDESESVSTECEEVVENEYTIDIANAQLLEAVVPSGRETVTVSKS